MLVFDHEFLLGDHRNCCTLWAREGKFKHVCFSIDTRILPNAPKEPHPDFAELEFCERERSNRSGLSACFC
jgi:hypothetical protein